MIINGKVDVRNVDFQELCEVIDSCKGNVYLTTEDGNKLNLKSKLCQLIGLTQILKCATVEEVILICDNPEDESTLFKYNLYGKHKD